MTENNPEKLFEKYADFPGARRLGMPYKKAVELFTKEKLGDRIGNGLTLVDIRHEFPLLRQAIQTYKKQTGRAPFDIPSMQDIAHDRVARVLANGFLGTKLDRQAAMTMLRRQSRKTEPSRPQVDSCNGITTPVCK